MVAREPSANLATEGMRFFSFTYVEDKVFSPIYVCIDPLSTKAEKVRFPIFIGKKNRDSAGSSVEVW